MMKRLILLGCAIFFVLTATNVMAVSKGNTLSFDKSRMGTVTFDGTRHNEIATKGCRECHNPELFPKMKQGTVAILMENIYAGEQCGFCHNGGRAFAAKGNCKRCHQR